jgi:hypothetical protein
MGHDECKGYKRLPSLQWWRRALMSRRQAAFQLAERSLLNINKSPTATYRIG